MRVLFVTHKYPPDIGGTATMAQRIVGSLSESGHHVTVLTTREGIQSSNTGVDIVHVRRVPFLYLVALSLQLRRQVGRKAYDYIVLNDLPTSKSAALSFTTSMLQRTIILIHGSEPENVVGAPSILTRITWFHRLYMRLLRRSHSIVAFSSFMKHKFIRGLNMVELEPKLRVCRMAISIDAISANLSQICQDPAGDPERYIVLTVSRVVERKGFDRMLRIMSTVVAADKRMHWMIVGSGPYERQMRRKIEKSGLMDNVTLCGEITDALSLSRIYSSAHVFLLLSEYEEGLGVVYIEAAAHGIPSIANNKSGERESVEPGTSGFLTESDAEVIDILISRRADTLRKSPQIFAFAALFDTKHLAHCIFRCDQPSL